MTGTPVPPRDFVIAEHRNELSGNVYEVTQTSVDHEMMPLK